MKPSSATKRISRSAARNALLLNQLATPGLGSLLARRWVAGTGQLALALVGFAMFLAWFLMEVKSYYSQAFSEFPEHHPVSLHLLVWGSGLFALAWLWSLVTSFALMREASRVDLASLETFAASQTKASEPQIVLALASLPHWSRAGASLARTYEFKDFPAAMKFVNAVADLAEQSRHHPDIDVRWNRVTLSLTTHDAGGLTENDFALARGCDALSPG